MLINNSNDNQVNYKYDVSVKFDKTGATTSATPIKYATADLIKSTITAHHFQDGTPAANTKVVMQLNPPSADVTVFNRDGSFAINDEDLGEGAFLFTTDDLGQAKFYFASVNNGYQNISTYTYDKTSSEANEYVVFFGDYSHADAQIPSPALDLDEQSVLQISQTDPYFYVSLIQADQITVPEGNSCVAIVNGDYFRKMPYQDALESAGLGIPSAWLSTEHKNEISYFIENDTSAAVFSSPTLSFMAEGIPYNHPKVDPAFPRELQSRPYLNTGQTSITTSNYSNLYVNLDRIKEQNGEFTYNAGDTIKFTLYINGYYPGSIVPFVNVINLEPIKLPFTCPIKASAQIPASILEGFGANISNTPGRYDIDYTVVRANQTEEKKWGRPMHWLKGNINTVG